jgi:Cu(I)/Ag(I) efflux system membrane fusion protein
VPGEAVLEAGLRQTVYVDRGNGYFEPRNVHLGSRAGDQVQVTQGLMPGERIVVSGNFLLDSESRMKLAAAGVHGASAIDPVCGMTVDEGKAKAAGRLSQYQGQNFYFCNDGCKKRFDADPAKYLAKATSPSMTMAAPESKEAKDLVCGMKVDEAEAKAAKLTSEHQGKTYFFCNETCKKQFDANPGKYLMAARPK